MFIESLNFCRAIWTPKTQAFPPWRIHSPMILTKTLFFLLPSNSP